MDAERAEGSPGFRGVLNPASFVGRESEFAALDAALERAMRFRAPQMVTIVGPLGIGKTRLLGEWMAAVGGPGLKIVRVSLTVDALADGPQNLMGGLLRQRFGITPEMGPEAALVQFRQQLREVFADRRIAEVAALLGRFLGFDLRDSPLSQALADLPEQGADLARAVLGRFLEQDVRDQPAIWAVDDLHLADDASLDILGRLAGELGEGALVLLGTGRPDLLLRRPEWGHGDGSHSRLELGPLGRRELDTMIRSVLEAGGHEPLPSALVDRAVEESGGNPYLLEQLLHLYHREGILVAERGEGWWFDSQRADWEGLSLNPEEAAQSRVGDLSPAERGILQRAAAFGSVFWSGGLISLGRLAADPGDPLGVFGSDGAREQLRTVLARLAERDLLSRADESSVPGDTEWRFKHALDLDLIVAGADAVLLARKRRYAAQWLEAHGGAAIEFRYEQLGQLYEDGGDSRRAAACYLGAADGARTRVELERARSLYLRALRHLDSDEALVKMDAAYAVGDVAARLGRTREALAHFQELLRLAWRLDLPAKGGVAHGRIGRLHGVLGEHRAALDHLELARQLFETAGDLPGIAAALDDIGRLHALGGSPEASLECHREAYRVRERLGDDLGKALALSRMGEVEHQTGNLLAAEGHLRQSLELRRRAGDRQGMVASLLDLGALERDLGRVEGAIAILEEGRRMAGEIGERLFECSIAIEMGDCFLAAAKPLEARGLFMEAKDIARQFGAKLLLCEAGRGLAEVELARGELLAARDEALTAFELAERIGTPAVAGAALRVAASSVGLGAPGDSDRGGAREMFDRSVEILSNAGSELELGRALAAYAEFEHRTGRKSTARELRRQAELIRDRARGSRRARRLPTPPVEAPAVTPG